MSPYYNMLRQNAAGRPITHGNGFIQVPMSAGERVHVWHPRCPRQTTYTGIHDHRFSFNSVILRGRLLNRRWSTGEGADYRVLRSGHRNEIMGEDPLKLYDTELTCTLHTGYERTYGEGSRYSMPIGAVHDSIPVTEFVVTRMRKMSEAEFAPRVLCLVGQEPDNDFRRDGCPAETLWTLVEEALR